MHDFELEHEHDDLSEADREAIARAIWEQDTLELTTVGIDIGSSTTHLLLHESLSADNRSGCPAVLW